MDNEQLVARIRAGEDVAKNMLELYNQNRGFIVKVAKRYQGFAEMEDLLQEGYIGLSEAVRHYDADKNSSFIHYAAFWIRQSMSRYVDNCGSVVRIPVQARGEIREYNRVVREYRKYYGEWPSDCALCRLLGVTREKLQEIRKSVQIGQMRSLSEVLGGDGEEFTLEDSIASDQDLEGDAIREADTAAMKRDLWVAVDSLPGGLPEVIKKRFLDGRTLKEISQEWGVTYSKVHDIQNKALRTLRQPGISRKYRRYYEEYISAECCYHVGVESFQRTWTSEVEREVLGWMQ